jgi:hypothetical protein
VICEFVDRQDAEIGKTMEDIIKIKIMGEKKIIIFFNNI